MQRNTGYFPTESLEPCGNRLFSRSALNEGYLFRGSLDLIKECDCMKKMILGIVWQLMGFLGSIIILCSAAPYGSVIQLSVYLYSNIQALDNKAPI